MKKFVFITLLLLGIIFGCSTEKNSKPYHYSVDLSNLYKPGATTLYPKFVAYNVNDSETIVFNYFYLPQLLFLPKHNTWEAKILIKYLITPSLDNRTVLDSVSKILVIHKNKMQQSISFPIEFTYKDTSMLLNIFVKDLYRDKSSLNFIYLDKKHKNSLQNFLLKYADNLQPVFSNVIYPNYNYIIEHNSDTPKIFVYHYPLDRSLPKPPFYIGSRTKKIYADTTFSIKEREKFAFNKPGVYLFSVDSLDQHGKTVLLVDNYFPVVQLASQMIPPLCYITTTYEYKKLLQAYSPKLTVDSFWLSRSQDPDRAKQLIKIYYNRVFFANLYFTSYKPGWATDRGMIFIIFGPPQYMYKHDNSEIWYYYNPMQGNYVKFYFYKNKNHLSDNDFILKPDPDYRGLWKHAVKQWRSGTVPQI